MKLNRGRFGQYKVLFDDERLQQHLVPTVVFTEKSLQASLEMYETVVLKPVFRPEEIHVRKQGTLFHIEQHYEAIAVVNEDNLFEEIKKLMKSKYYLIQPQQNTKLFSYIVTMNKDQQSKKWRFSSKINVENRFLQNIVFSFYYYKILRLAKIITKRLSEAYPSSKTVDILITISPQGKIKIVETTLHYSVSKWSQYNVLKLNKRLKRFIPKTNLLTYATFSNFMNHFQEIILKPCNGQQGRGIVKVRKIAADHYEIHALNTVQTKRHIDELYSYLTKCYFSKNQYIVQQKIHIATIMKCPIDVRVITQKKDSEWIVTGQIVKVAGEGFFITNAIQKLCTLEEALLTSSIEMRSSNVLLNKVNCLCILASRQLNRHLPDLNIIGFDIGITNNGHIFIFEGNYMPDISMFNHLQDKTMYKRILELRHKEK
ncbi:YheC/YheD family protein [Solibacillus sp. CAU 1738]|uniref:YheC/YheD family protein n=1 Tax=Solibacillus sp. CAU 1738 TaxID=3140363 RepID=UPI003260D0DE